MVTHSSTSRPVQCLCMAERTGCPVFTDLWSYVMNPQSTKYIILSYEETGEHRNLINRVTFVALVM
jgi:hypothetical protein